MALGAVAAATAAAELVRNSQDAQLAEHQRKIAELEEGLRKSQAEKEEQLCRLRKEQATDRESIDKLRFSLERALEESSQDQQRLLEVSRERDEAENLQQETETEYRSLLFDSHRQINDLREHTGNLQRKLAVAEDKQAAQLAKQSYGHVQLQSRLENAQAEIKTLKQSGRALEKSLSSPARRLSARAQPKMLPAISANTCLLYTSRCV